MPEWKKTIRRQLAGLRLPPAREAEIVEELAQHAEDRYRELRSGGTAEAEARRLALEDIGGHELLARELRKVERRQAETPAPGAEKGGLWSGLTQDVRFGLRTLRKSPDFTVVALFALALGIGANTAIFSVVNGVLLRPLRYPDPDRLVRIHEVRAQFGRSTAAYPNFQDWQRESRSFSGMGTFRDDDFNFTGTGQPEHLEGLYVSPGLFSALDVKPVLGRDFGPAEDRPGTACSVILSYDFWQRRFAGDPHILGRQMALNAASCTVAGVMPRDFQLIRGAEVFVPIEQYPSAELHTRDSHPGLRVYARLRPGVTMAAAEAELNGIAAQLGRLYPVTNAGSGVKLVPLKDDLVGRIRPTLLLLLGAVGFVLIIACANVANLLLARSTARRREFAIRAALGAARGRVVRQVLTESVMVALGGAALGLMLASWGTKLVVAAAPGSLPRAQEVAIDPYVLLFTLGVSILTGVLFGLAPAFQGANINPQATLRESLRGGGGRRHTEGIFVAMEMGLAVVLLAGAGLMMQSVWRLWQVQPGFNTHHLLKTQVAVSPQVMTNPVGIRLAYRQILERVSATPGIRTAAFTTLVPLGEDDSEISYWLGTGPQPPPDKTSSSLFTVVTPAYLETMQIPLRRGRFFTEHDDLKSPPVAVIDETLAQHAFPGQDPIGKRMSMVVIGTVEIAGVVGHVKHWGLDSDDTAKIRDQIYFPLWQIPDKFMTEGVVGLTLVTRTEAEPLSMVAAVRARVAGPTQDQPIYSVRSMEQVVEGSLAERRFTMLLLIIFACSAVLLAAVGIYGVMSYTVARRTNELGIRAALGATRAELMGIVLRQGMRLAAIGMACGLAASVLLTRFLAGLLYGVRPADPLTLAAVVLVLGAIALAACGIPARRATAVDPVVALRCE